jgi:hypothetical protein
MSRHDTPDTFSGPALTVGDGTGRYRAIRIDRNQLATTHPRALGVAVDSAAPIQVGEGDIKLGELLSRPESVDLQVFVVEIEDDGEFVALAERDAIVNYPPQHAVLRISDWGDAHGPDLRTILDEIPFDDGRSDPWHDAGDDSLRRTAAERERSGRHAHHPARRQQTGAQGGWVG